MNFVSLFIEQPSYIKFQNNLLKFWVNIQKIFLKFEKTLIEKR